MSRTNGGLKVATAVLTGAVLLLGGALVTAYAGASAHISRTDAQAMVDRGDDTINKRLERIEDMLRLLVIAQGPSP